MKKTLSLVIAGVILTSTLAGCTNTSTQTKTEGPQTVKIGVIAPLSGPAAVYGEDAITFYKYLVDKFNIENSGSINIQLIIEDGKCSGKDSASAAQKLVLVDKVDMIRGGMCSSETIAAGKISQANKVFTIAPASSAPEISDIGDYVYRLYNDSQTAKSLAEYSQKHFNKIAVLTENTDYAVGLYKKFKQEYSGNILVDDKFQSDEKDYSMLVNKLKGSDIDGLILITQTDSTTISLVKTLKSSGLGNLIKSTMGIYICSSEVFLKQAGDIAQGMRCFDLPTMDYLSSNAKQFIQAYKKTHTIKAFESWIVLQKESADMTLDAIKKGNYTSDSIKKYFENINQNNTWNGYFGEVYFKNRDLVGLPYMIEEVSGGKVSLIK